MFMWSPSKAIAQRRLKRRSSLRADVDPWPLVGPFVALLIIFMVLPQPHHGMAIDLFATSFASPQPLALREDAIRFSVTRDGNIYFRNQKIGPELIPQQVRDFVRAGAERKIYLTVDQRAQYGDVALVLDQIRETSVRTICLIAEKRARP